MSCHTITASKTTNTVPITHKARSIKNILSPFDYNLVTTVLQCYICVKKRGSLTMLLLVMVNNNKHVSHTQDQPIPFKCICPLIGGQFLNQLIFSPLFICLTNQHTRIIFVLVCLRYYKFMESEYP